ncbi:rhodanese-related sulfurtransferase [Lewinella marina]|uniref:Sulfurtransferase n=1 Tax=Neolewinella marina TaxID=438751 RepID=A0A2G0CBE2_9BACT|nr:rhodanese-like domain-containing protein [Neolewinella marina]NJB87806.1 rhodanese-related sulfurtransferase [Neolewinella marina]PHK97275.1 sulfurtransferase [Neolewinella marina]
MRYLNVSLLTLVACFVYACGLGSQELPPRLRTGYPPLDERLSRMVTVDSLSLSPAEVRRLPHPLLLDAREPEEYAVSHLPGAENIGYDDARYGLLEGVDRDRPVVVYCTIGYRSERMAEELRSRGFRRVYNLYGSIYAWALAGYPLVDEDGPTRRLHTYNRKWGTYFPDSLATKVY